MAPSAGRRSSYLQDLPAIFSEDDFLGRFLLTFEHVLTGLKDGALVDRGDTRIKVTGLEETIASVASLFDPSDTPTEFLGWLANWVALGLRVDWAVPQQRAFLGKIVPLYRLRGTKNNLAELLHIYTDLSPVITETSTADFQIGHSTVGDDTYIGGGIPHHFTVTVTMATPDAATLERHHRIARALIDLQKPAHTSYTLTILHDTMQIGDRSTIGLNTLLST